MLPLVVLRRFDCVLKSTKEEVLKKHEEIQKKNEAARQKNKELAEKNKETLETFRVAHEEYERTGANPDKYASSKKSVSNINDRNIPETTGNALDLILNSVSRQRFHNHSPLNFEKLKGDPENIHLHLTSYIQGFSENVRKIFERFDFTAEIERMREHDILFLVVSRFCDVDLHPDVVDNIDMGLLFEDLIRRFNEQANETAGDHFTPREVIRLMVNLLFINDDNLLSKPGTVRKMLDPTCGTGGMLSEARNYLLEHESKAKLYVYGQDFNPRSFAVAASDLLMKEDPKESSQSTIRFGDSLLDDQFKYDETNSDRKATFDYFCANPPFGVDWKRQSKEVNRESEKEGFNGRFGAGTPRVNDGALLFLQHMVDKFEAVEPEKDRYGSRLAIVFNGSPLFTGGAGSGESNIRKWIIENDWLEAIVAMPEQMFYNTGIGTYVWIVTNRKDKRRKGKIQLIDAREVWIPLRRSLGDKRRKFAVASIDTNKPDALADDIPFNGYSCTNGFRDDIRFITDVYCQYDKGISGDIESIIFCGRNGKTQKRVFREYTEKNPDEFNPATDKRCVVSKIFDNDDFGYARITVERPLRLTYQMSLEKKELFLEYCPELLHDLQAIDKDLGREPSGDWNEIWKAVQKLLKKRESKWKAPQVKTFRSIFTQVYETAEPVIKKKSKGKVDYEPDPKLRDFENVPLKESIEEYFQREVLPHVPDAWIDEDKTKIGYEINFNRYFYKFTELRPLEEIDVDIKAAEEEFLRLLKEVTVI
jgi:type I restriction enzyme M protein